MSSDDCKARLSLLMWYIKILLIFRYKFRCSCSTCSETIVSQNPLCYNSLEKNKCKKEKNLWKHLCKAGYLYGFM